MEIRSSVSSYSLLQSHSNEFDHRARALFEAEGLALRRRSEFLRLFLVLLGRLRGFFFMHPLLFV